jgi:hypothetical protein
MNWQRFRMKWSQLIKVLCRNFPERAEENNEKRSLISQSHGRDSNRAPPKYKSTALPLDQSAKHGNLLSLLTSLTKKLG